MNNCRLPIRTARLRPQALGTFRDKSRSAAWRTIPSSYLVCEDDRAIPVQFQDGIEKLRSQVGRLRPKAVRVS
jgi:hypothetical protein